MATAPGTSAAAAVSSPGLDKGTRPGAQSSPVGSEPFGIATTPSASLPDSVAAGPPSGATAAVKQKGEAAAVRAAQQQATGQEQAQHAIAVSEQDGTLPAQLQQILALQQQALAQQQQQQERQQQQQQQRHAAPPAVGAVVTDDPRGNEWAAEPLFGGAMEMELPMRFHDISKFRPVPDHQEVFADAHQDQSLVIEILEMAKVEDDRCAHYFFEDLAVQNEAQSSAMETVYTLNAVEVPNLPSQSVCTCALGYQTIAKGRQPQDTSNYVQIILGVVRLPQVQSDIVISLNTPAYIHEKSASAEHAGAGAKTAYLRAPDLFKRMLQSFKILDMSLFGSS